MAHERIKPEFLFDEEKIKQLKQIAPECFEDGKLNFETLRQNLGDWAQDEEDGELEHFGLFWPGKKDARRLATIPPEGTLEPVYGEGLKSDGTPDDDGVNDSKNIFIEGENLEVLKILQKSYANKIKMIYIDPPYNTGNDFVYDDDFTEPLQEYLRRTGQIDEEGKPLTTNKKSDGRFHSKWLSMMYPRLRLARNLLKEDGVIFVSIDDNEVHNLRALLNEVFGEENFVESFVWRRRKTQANLSKYTAPVHDYILCYAFNKDEISINRIPYSKEFIAKTFKNPDNDPKGVYQTGPLARPANSGNREYELTMPNGRKITAKWSCSQETFNKYVEENRLVIPRGGEGMPRIKIYLTELPGQIPNSWLDNIASNDEASKEIEELMGSNAFFSYPKPTNLIKYLLKMGTSSKTNDIILDFFAGSGTTGQAVSDLNNEDDGNRQWINIQFPEVLDSKNYAATKGFEKISDVTKERLKRAQKLNSKIEGIKIYSLVETNYRKWNDVKGKDISRLENSLDLFNSSPLREDWNKNKLIAELMLLEGFPLDATKSKSQIGSNEIVKIVSEMVPNNLLICLDDEIEESLIDQLELGNASTFICLDSAISNQNKLRLSDKGLIKTI